MIMLAHGDGENIEYLKSRFTITLSMVTDVIQLVYILLVLLLLVPCKTTMHAAKIAPYFNTVIFQSAHVALTNLVSTERPTTFSLNS